MLSIDTQNISDFSLGTYKPSGKSEILSHQLVVDLGPEVIQNTTFQFFFSIVSSIFSGSTPSCEIFDQSLGLKV